MPAKPRFGLDQAAELVLDPVDGVAEDLEQVAARLVLVEHGERGDRDRAGDLARGCAAHAVGDDEQAGTGVAAVLVAVTEQADVGAGGVAQGQRHGAPARVHLRSSITVLPMRIGCPSGTVMAPVTRVRWT